MLTFRSIASKPLIGGLLFALTVSTTSIPMARASDCDAVKAAVANEARSDKDRGRDADRKPADVLCFLGAGPDTHVIDMFAGGGYYTEILAHLASPDGLVTAHNANAAKEYAAEAIAARYGDDRLPNITLIYQESNELDLGTDKYDLVLMILTYHDIYWIPQGATEPSMNGPKILASVLGAMKPGGVLGIVDHVAPAGAPSSTGNTTHRIDPALMRSEIEAAGFVFDGESDVLRNPEDDLEKPMWTEGLRGKTDRVVYRFKKPA